MPLPANPPFLSQNKHAFGSPEKSVRSFDVIIVGGGAIGKAAALGFARNGLKVALLADSGTQSTAQLSSDRWDTRVYALNRQARGFLSSLKVWDALDASRVAAVDAMVVDGDQAGSSGDAGGPGRLTFDAFSARVDALAWIVEDGNLNRALDAALRFAPDVAIVTGRAAALEVDDERATIELESGEQLAASLVLGADGGQSWVRSRCDIDLDTRQYHQRAVVSNFSCEHAHHGVAYQRFAGTDGVIALLPLPGNRVSLVWSAPDRLAEKLMAIPFGDLADRVAQAVGHRLGILAPLQPEVRQAFPLTLLRPRRITAPRVALAGDAAHVIHPLAGQGMNLGFADVAVLLDLVAQRGAFRDCGDARVLGRYERARKEDILAMQVATDGLARLFASDAAPLRAIRNVGLALVDRLPGIKRELMAQALGSDANRRT